MDIMFAHQLQINLFPRLGNEGKRVKAPYTIKQLLPIKQL